MEEQPVTQPEPEWVLNLTAEDIKSMLDNAKQLAAEREELKASTPPVPEQIDLPARPFCSRLLWEEELRRTNSDTSKCTAWLTLYLVCEEERNAQGLPGETTFQVKYTDLLSKPTERHNITNTPLGQFVIAAWLALNPAKFAALPKNSVEWEEDVRRAAMQDVISEVFEHGIDTSAMSEEEIVECWHKIITDRRVAEYLAEGLSAEDIEHKLHLEPGTVKLNYDSQSK